VTLTLRGRGLHSGRAVALTLRRAPGPVRFVGPRGAATRDQLRVVRADRGVRVVAPEAGVDIDLVEHLLAALGGLGVHEGVELDVQGGEVPLLDGGAASIAQALVEIAAPRSDPVLRAARAAHVELNGSVYELEPGPATSLEVEVEFAPLAPEHASWDGRPETFVREIAWARTFGFRRDAERLRRAGRAVAVDPAAVLVLDDAGRAEPGCTPARPGELARHKLLDLIGDLYLFGGPPEGCLRARRPGHAATHAAVRNWLADGSFSASRGRAALDAGDRAAS
jgi:UDP-3-O-[3-hydroxymyristoyl] N-acetylglucosamine deacetylase